jgi:aspartate kinase
MKLVMKLGGTSLGESSRIKHVASIVRDHALKGDKIVVVVSAMSGVTDQLIEAAEKACMRDRASIDAFVKALAERHSRTCQDVINNREILETTLSSLNGQIAELEKVLVGITYLGELTSRSRDYVLSFGEKLSAIVMSGALKDLGLRIESFLGRQCGIVTDDCFGEAKPLMNTTRQQVKEKLGPVIEAGVVAVVTGFIGTTQDGLTTTLGRGGSDYTATILGAALQVDEVWMWTDVDGLMTADPKVEPSAKTIPIISYSEAMEMAYFGAKAMHPRALEPASERGIPIRVKNTFNPDSPGTLIVQERQVKPKSIVKTVAMIRNVALITASGAGMVGAPGIAAKVFSVLGENEINVLMISQSSSEANISFVIPRASLEKAVNTLELSLLGSGFVKEVTSETGICIVAVVGDGMKGTPGVAARVFKAVSDQGVNVRMIAQGSSELNISFVVEDSGGVKALRALHREFKLDCQGSL